MSKRVVNLEVTVYEDRPAIEVIEMVVTAMNAAGVEWASVTGVRDLAKDVALLTEERSLVLAHLAKANAHLVKLAERSELLTERDKVIVALAAERDSFYERFRSEEKATKKLRADLRRLKKAGAK